MQDFIDRLGKAAQQTASETRLRLAVRTINGKLDDRAQALGHMLFRRHEGETVSEADMLKILKEMSDLKAERQAREAELDALHKASEPARSPLPPPSRQRQPPRRRLPPPRRRPLLTRLLPQTRRPPRRCPASRRAMGSRARRSRIVVIPKAVANSLAVPSRSVDGDWDRGIRDHGLGMAP